MRLTIVLFAIGIASFCQPKQPPILSVAPPPDFPTVVVTKLLITTTVDDDVRICFEVTSGMRLLQPTVDREMCGMTVGELRREFAHTYSAN